MQFDTFVNKKSLIIGEVNTGKTAFTREILEIFLSGGETDVAIIDMAPDKVKGIGGKMHLKTAGAIRYYTAPVVPPRLTGKTRQEVKTLARQNAAALDRIMETFLKNPAKVLFINDVSIYLQAGSQEKLLQLINSVPTVIMNGYYGVSLGGGELGERESQNMKFLQDACDIIILLKPRKKGRVFPISPGADQACD